MKWIEVKISASTEGLAFVEAILVNRGVGGWKTDDADEARSFFEANPRAWDYLDESVFDEYDEPSITFYLADAAAGREALVSIETDVGRLRGSDSGIDLGPLAVSSKIVDDEDWADNWKKYYKPIPVGRSIVIKPAWESYVDGSGTKRVIVVNPGHLFGTGQHETTRMCVEAIEEYMTRDVSCLDLGCGSGILSLTALALGAADCTAVDFDPGAEGIVNENAELNGVTRGLTVLTGDILTDRALHRRIGAKKYGLVVANITADAIISVSRIVKEEGWLAPGGAFVASGIIAGRLVDAREALVSDGFDIVGVASAGEWVCVVCRNFS